jgi:hypothetical protein
MGFAKFFAKIIYKSFHKKCMVQDGFLKKFLFLQKFLQKVFIFAKVFVKIFVFAIVFAISLFSKPSAKNKIFSIDF